MSARELLKHLGLGQTLVPIHGDSIRRDEKGKKIKVIIDPVTGKKRVVFWPESGYNERAANGTLPTVDERTLNYGFVAGIENAEGQSLIVIDADSQYAADRLITLLHKNKDFKDYPFLWHSHYDNPTEEQGGVKILFWNSDSTKKLYTGSEARVPNPNIQVDTLNGGLIYCPCEKNEAAKPWTWDGHSTPKTIPDNIQVWLKLEKDKAIADKAVRNTNEVLSMEQFEGFHAEALEAFVASAEGSISSDLRNIWFNRREYRVNNAEGGERLENVWEVPDGLGNEFLKQVNGIMTLDQSVKPDLAIRVLNKINSLWESKGIGAKEDLNSSIVVPYIEKRVADGEWPYNPNWKKIQDSGFRFKDDDSNEWEIIVDKDEVVFLAVCKTTRTYKYLEDATKVRKFLLPMGHYMPSGQEGEKRLLKCRKFMIVIDITQKFGITREGYFNIFRQNPYMDCFQNPKKYKEGRQHPTEFLALLKNNVHRDEYVNKLCAYWSTYFRTGKRAALNFYFIGEQGSGKSAIGETLVSLLGIENCQVFIDTDHFMEKFDAKLKGKYIILLEEIGEQVAQEGKVNRKFLGKIRAYTTSPFPSLRSMYSNEMKPYKSQWMFVCNSNQMHLPIPADDRRSVIFKSEKHLSDSEIYFEWIEKHKDLIGKKPPLDYFMDERIRSPEALLDIAYYLATEFPDDVVGPDWSRAWFTAAKGEVAGTTLFMDQLIEWVKTGDLVSLYADGLEFGITDILITIKDEDGIFIPIEPLIELFEQHGEKHKTLNYMKQYFFNIHTGDYKERNPFAKFSQLRKHKGMDGNKRPRVGGYLLNKYPYQGTLEEIQQRAKEYLQAKISKRNEEIFKETGFKPVEDNKEEGDAS